MWHNRQRIAAEAFVGAPGRPIAVVNFIGKDYCHFQSAVGVSAPGMERKLSICSWTLIPVNPEVLVRPNLMSGDESFAICQFLVPSPSLTQSFCRHRPLLLPNPDSSVMNLVALY